MSVMTFFMTHSLMLLDISGNLFQSLPLDSLRNVHTLSRLIAQRNQIQHLDGNWGNLADSLRSLHLSSNTISEITQLHTNSGSSFSNNNNISSASSSSSILSSSAIIPTMSGSNSAPSSDMRTFSKLRKLVWLDLSNNRIAHVSYNLMPKSLVTIDLSRNVLSTFPMSLVEHLRDLKILNLRDNLIGKLYNIEFSIQLSGKPQQRPAYSLEKLDLSQNVIDEIPSNLFNSTIRIKALSLDKNFIKRIPGNAFRDMGVVHLVLAFNYISEIDENGFDTLENTLEYLDLERNQLMYVPLAISKLQKLKYLYLTSNEIAHLEYMPPTLRVLSLSSNNFTQIPSESLMNCTELSYLNMGYNQIREMSEDIFLGWGSNLQTLLLRNNKITHLNYNTFNGLDTIKEISLSFNDIHYVQPMVFENISRTLKILELSFGIYRDDFPLEPISYLTELMWLGLDNNNLKMIPGHSLHSLTQLTYVNLAFNRITFLPRNIFLSDVHKNLLEIDLSFNQIECVLSNTFDDLDLLQIVNLASNRIQSIEKYSFYNLQLLTYLDLSYNRITNISDMAFQFLPNILSIDLMYNQLTKFSFKAFMHITNATTPMRLNISNNYIRTIDGDLSSYFYIYSLDLSNNLIWDTQSFKNIGYSLRVLYLNNNNITQLANHAFGDLNMLEILNLANNSIHSLRRRSFQGLSNLQELDLSMNEIEMLQIEQFSNLGKLRVLNLSYNKLRTIPKNAFYNTRIERLDLSFNNIGLFPVGALSEIGFTLRALDIQNNQIESIDSTMFQNTQFLLDLNLASNQIKILSDNAFASLNNLTFLDLSYNTLTPPPNYKEFFLNTPRLRTLKLRGIGLYRMPNLPLKYLTLLDVGKNYLQEVEGLYDMRNLREFYINENRVVNLGNVTRFLPSCLRKLDISRNPIRKQSLYDFTQIRRIEELNIENVKIINSELFVKLHNLKKIRISSQANFSDLISKLKGLRELHVHIYDDRIREEFFSKLTALTKLTLLEITGFKLTNIHPRAFNGLARNQDLKIRITHTNVYDLPIGIFYPLKYIPRLSIDLSNNKLAALSPDSFYPNASSWDAVGTRSVFGGMNIAGNPLQCECGLVWLGHWLRRWLRETAQVNILNKEELKQMLLKSRDSTCTDVITGKKLSFLEIFPEDLLCHASALSSKSVLIFTTTSLRISLLLNTIIVLFVSYRLYY
uniref:CSON003104 protein n=1 Tax=Culicoides sonorensis TaxID=179676 RepID=A0A336MLY2_CULSO